MKFIELFAGVGGFRYGLESVGKQQEAGKQGVRYNRDKPCSLVVNGNEWNKPYQCIYANEFNKYAAQIYERNFNEQYKKGGESLQRTERGGVQSRGDKSYIKVGGNSEPETWGDRKFKQPKDIIDTRDIREVPASEIPDHELLTAGFPCQAFSIAGKRGGFEDTRGTLFFEIARIVKQKQPRLLLLENVKGLLSHDKGKTFGTILNTLDELGYDLQWQVLNSKDFGVPQNRERVFIVGHKRNTRRPEVFPIKSTYERVTHILSRERMYWLSQDFSSDIGVLLQELPQSKGQDLSKQQMSELLTRLQQEISQGKSGESEGEAEGLDTDTEGGLQVIEELNSWASSKNNSEEVCGVVQLPTEEVLLLWFNGGDASISFGQVQQQDLSFISGQNRLLKGLRGGKFSTLLFAVQPYQGRLFYSIGNGRDWRKVYSTEVEERCKNTLSSILEEQVDQKYFLSEQATKSLLEKSHIV